MKKLITIVLLAIVFIQSGFAQENPEIKHNVGISLIPTIIGLINMHYGYVFDNGSKEINASLYYPLKSITENGTAIACGLNYRNYIYSDFQGMHLSPSLYFIYGSFIGKFLSSSRYYVEPAIEIGYRWLWESGFSLNTDIGLGYVFFEKDHTFEGSSVKIEDLLDDGFFPTGGVQISYAF